MPQSSAAPTEVGGGTRERQRLISPVALIAMAALATGGLVVVFPGAGLLDQVYRYERHDELSATYIASLLKNDPGNRKLRVALVERELDSGNLAAARGAMEPLRGPAESGDREIAMLEYRLTRAETNRARETPEGAQSLARARQELTALARLDGWEPRHVEYFAREARALGLPAVAARQYQRLAALDPAQAPAWSERAAQAALEGGDYAAAAGAWLAAREGAASASERRDYFLRALKALQSGNRLAEALALADAQLGEFATDDTVLLYLLGLARAANDQRRAQAYARMLMRMGGTRARGGVLAALLGTLVGAAHAAAAPAPAGMRPYDEEKYTLAYEVFLGARNLEDAYRVAQAAVAQVPQHAGWRQRLAQVAEWTGRPAVALEQWRWLAAAAATATERERAWQAVLRLAPAAGDDEALLAAWLHAAETQPMNAERWRRIAEGFERVARPADGAQYFQRRYERSAEPLFLELRAYLLERLGRDEEAIAAYAALIEKHGAEGSRLLRAATLLLRHNRFREAFRLLDRHRRAVAQADAEFWNLFADLAWRLQQDAAAREAYETLARRPEAGELVWGRLVELTRDKDPAGAARVAALGYERTRSPALAVLATELYWQQRDLVELRRFHAAMSAQDEQRLAGNAYFFALRAQFHDADGRPREAVADYRRAIAIEPGNADLVSALLWHLVSRKETAALRRELARYEPRARESGGLAEVYAAAYAVLGELPRALAYYARLRDNKRDDYLWLLGYADVLEQAGNGAMALRVRRHAWQAMRAELKGRGERDLSRAELEAVARMTLADSPGDPALALVGRVLRQDFVRDPPDAPTRELDAGVRELVLSWALSTERMDAAKAWLWSQYARQLARPTWAQMSIALAENDREAVARLLAADDGALPVYDRIEAARVTARLRLAQTYAFDAQEKRRDDDELHVKLTETLLESANAIVYTDVPFERGVLKGREQRAVVRVWANERLRLALDFGGDGRLASTNPAALTGVPGRIEEYGLAARWRHERAHTDVRVGYRSALGTHYPLSFAHTREWAPRVSGVLGFTLDERAPETNPLYVGGMRDRAAASFTWRVGLREYLTVEGWAARYHTQDDTYLGRGHGVYWEAGHLFRTAYPDLRVRVTGAHQSYRADGTVDARAARLDPSAVLGPRYFIPESFDVLGAYLSFGLDDRDRYSRGFRFFADVGPTWNSQLGEGFLFSVGGGRSVLGPDRLAAYFTRSKGGGSVGGFTTEFGVRYEYMFDRW